ncbi:hypothetical protein DLM76_10715 [Leptospira yasudae]|uniref:Uncharacterized protein n=1 Tax=Leptospira yasudae TaxID=2202201 RepID=A0ABX9M4N6_9LEPT|nr:hypothetical protein [Leptospira yasudae]RHX80641.1 hypothetical protein DLM77_07060 [Leptospira yasudae]RHX94538.1 hypothetical protein DLM76_10715 [Leptospira yasudae]TGK24290.1 hypothetical protein EHQ05_15275 [Leptospira yasudae]TGM00902.1 hypothetical protein EHQ86_20180 [Leptospira yasudae]
MQTGINRRQIILISAGVLLTILLAFGIYLFIFRSSGIQVGKSSESKVDLIGTWRVSPIVPAKQIRFISEKEAVLLEENGETKLYLLEDGEGLQLRRRGEETPSGYFLFRELKLNTWQGLWGDDLVVLKRLSAEN